MDADILAELAGQLEPLLPNAAERLSPLLPDKRFREMCSEYEAGARCLKRLEQSREKATDRIEEYVQLLADLRQEMLRYIHNQPGY
jgi:hypothetical protein